MERILKITILILLIGLPAWGATVWVNGSGSNTSPYDTKAKGATTLQTAMAAASAGDTIMVADGTYTGATNVISNSYVPPISDSTWTTIKAENDGAAIFDGEGTRNMFVLTGTSTINCHWIFEGLVWCNALADVVSMGSRSYVKFLRCGGYEAGTAANVNIFFISSYSSYILMENCYAFGRGRTGMTAWCSSAANRTSYIIFRNCVSRIDRVTSGEPCYNFGCTP